MRVILADRLHDELLRMFMKGIVMPGPVELVYCREPDFFRGLGIQGSFNQAALCSTGDGIPAGIGCRSIKRMYINGEPAQFGYLSSLRALPEHRGGVTSAIFGKLREVHRDGRTRGYLTTVIEGNEFATAALAGGREGMPRFCDFGRYLTRAVNLNRWRRPRAGARRFEFARGCDLPEAEVVRFLAEEGRKKQFYPAYDPGDFGSPRTGDFGLAGLQVALDRGRIAGTLGAWDQHAYKQTMVAAYRGALRYLYRAYNPLLAAAGYRPLPGPGEEIRMFYASFICARDNDPEVFAALLDRVYQERKGGAYHYCMVGLHERDPLNAALAGYRAIVYPSRLYLVCWPGDAAFCAGIRRDLVPYLELATM